MGILGSSCGMELGLGPAQADRGSGRRRCLRSDPVEREATEFRPLRWNRGRRDQGGRPDDSNPVRLLRTEMRLQRDPTMVVMRARGRRCSGIALREQRWAFVGHRRVVVRALYRNIDQLAVFRTGDVRNGCLVERPQQRRGKRQQGKRSAESAKQSVIWARADHGCRL